jgi:hypothetical protein
MNKIKKAILLFSIILSFSASANEVKPLEFLYKTKQIENNFVRYNEVITKNNIVESLTINKLEKTKIFEFNKLKHKKNMDNSYSGSILVDKSSQDLRKLKITFKEDNKNKKFKLTLETKQEESLVSKMLSGNKSDLINYLLKSKFELQIRNENDTSYLLSILDIDNKENLYKTLSNIKSNKVKEIFNIGKEELDTKELDYINYVITIENVLKLSITAKASLNKSTLILRDINVVSDVINPIVELREFEKIFNIVLSKGKNNKNIKELKINL